MKRLASWLLLALSPLAAAQQTTEQRLDEVFKPWDRTDAPGGAAYVSVKGRVVYRKAFGMANLESDVPNTVATVFDVGSVSKQFTATCVMLLQADGKLSIEDKAGDHLPEFPVLREHGITIRQLISHTSGLRDYLTLLAFKTGSATFTDEQVVEVLQGQRTLDFAPGASWSYSNSGYFLLKKLVEKVSGKSLAEFAKERIFDPLGMAHTRFLDDPTKLIPGRAFGYLPTQDGFRAGLTLIAADGAGGLWTTLDDMHKWVQNWKDNRLGGGADLYRGMQTKTMLSNGREVPYGLAFFVDDLKGVPRIQHGGDFIGFHALVSWFPEQDVVVVTMSNDGTQNAKSLNDRAAEVVLGDAVVASPEEATMEVQLTEEELKEYEGRYDLAGRIVTVRSEGTQLKVQVTGQPELDVYASAKDKFFYKIVEARIEFVRGEDGKVQSLTIFQGGATIPCPRAQDYKVPEAALDALVGIYYSAELDMLVHVRKHEDGLYASSGSIHEAAKLEPVAENRFSLLTLRVDVDTKDDVVTGLRFTMPRATNMKFQRLSSSPGA